MASTCDFDSHSVGSTPALPAKDVNKASLKLYSLALLILVY